MRPEIKETILNALRAYRGDDYERTKVAFRGYSDLVMDGEYGQSGKTRRQVLEEYAVHAAKVDAAIRFMSKQATHTPRESDAQLIIRQMNEIGRLTKLNAELLEALKAARLRMLKYGESREEIAEMDAVIARASGKEQAR